MSDNTWRFLCLDPTRAKPSDPASYETWKVTRKFLVTLYMLRLAKVEDIVYWEKYVI